MKKKISDKDKKDWQNFLSGKESLPVKDEDLVKKTPPETLTFDLHGYSLNDANVEVENIIQKSFEEGIKKIIVITGKGLHSQNKDNPYASKDLSILKYSVPEFIKSNELLMKKIIEIKEASVKDGGSGAFYIFLKKSG